jgi:hypothetical protein
MRGAISTFPAPRKVDITPLMENVLVQKRSRAVVTIRARTESDADPLVAVLAEVHLSDAYPMMATHVSREWLFDPGFEAAWVAHADGVSIGHIAVKRGYGGVAIERASRRRDARRRAVLRREGRARNGCRVCAVACGRRLRVREGHLVACRV